jgi:SAM-dependent methyltransferase
VVLRSILPRAPGSRQTREQLAALLPLLADPVTHAPLELVSQGRSDELRAATGATWPVRQNVPCLTPPREVLADRFGAAGVEAWQKVQRTGERAYRKRAEGNFSTGAFQPAVEVGALLATLDVESVLDVGCGALPLPAYMQATPDKRWTGIDPLDFKVARAFPFARAFADVLPFAAESFDCVVLCSSLDHSFDPATALGEARRVLRAGGRLVVEETVREPDERFRRWQEQSAAGTARYNDFHNWAFVDETLVATIEGAGFAVDDVRAPEAAERIVVATRS